MAVGFIRNMLKIQTNENLFQKKREQVKSNQNLVALLHQRLETFSDLDRGFRKS